MTPYDLQVIRETFRAAAIDPQGFYTDFRRRALKLDSTTRQVLAALEPQGAQRLFDILGSALHDIDGTEQAPLAAQALARRYRGDGMQPKHYGVIGQAFLDTLAVRLGSNFNDNARAAWADAYILVAEAMMAQRYNQMDLVA